MLRLRRSLPSRVGRVLSDDRGSALALALVFMIFIALFLATLLSFVDANLRISTQLEGLRKDQYAVDGAVDAAIRQYELTGECPETVTFNGVPVDLECPSAGLNGDEGNNANNTPEQAILTLSTHASETGININNNNKSYSVLGDVFSNNSISVSSSGNLSVTGDVTAHSCPSNSQNRITATGSKVCDSTEVKPDPGEGNALYDPMVATPPAAAAVPACSASGQPVNFSPGTYSSASDLSSRMSTCDRTFEFAPGAYYFNFTDTVDINCGGINQPRQWCINNGNSNFRIIGGTPTSDGLACDPAEPGVQFIFGRDSRLNHIAGQASICAEPSADRQRIAIFGVKPSELKPDAATSSSSPAFSTTAGALIIGDGSTASASLPNANQTAAIDLIGYDDFAVPAGNVDRALLRVSHSESNTSRVNWIRVTVTPPLPGLPASFSNNPTGCLLLQGAIPPCTVVSTLTPSTTLHSDWVDVTSLLNNSTRFPPAVKYEIRKTSSSSALTAVLDGIWVEVTPAGSFSGQTGCLIEQPYAGPTSTHCPLVRTDGSNTEFRVDGTVYAPRAPLQLKCPNNCSELFARGIVARALRIEQPSSSSEETAIEIPQDGEGAGVTPVIFIAEVDGVTRLRALVEFQEGEPPEVLNWSVVRP
jgi:hypothetical protein